MTISSPVTLPRGAAVRDRLRWLDPWTGVVCAVALVTYLLHGFDGYLSRDLGVYAYAGEKVADGVPPYVGILNRAGPLAHLIPGIGAFAARAVGIDELFGMRLLFTLISVAAVGVTYRLGRDVFRSQLAGLGAAAALLCSHGFVTYATYGPREKTAMVLFLLCALLATTHQRWVVAGAFIALGTLTWQPVFLAAIAGAVVALLLGVRTGRLRALGELVVGGLVPTAITVGWYAAIGHLQVFLDDFLLINARYTEQISPLDYPGWIWEILVRGYGWSLWVFIVGALAVLVLAVHAAITRTWRREPADAALVGAGATIVVGFLWSLRAFNGWPDAFVMLPAAALGIGGLVAAFGRRFPGRTTVVLALAWVLAATTATVVFSAGTRNHQLDEQRADVAAVLSLLPADPTVLSVEAPEPLVLGHLTNLSRFQLFGNGLEEYLEDTWPGGSAGYGRWVAERRPTLIALGRVDPPEWLAPVLLESYRKVGVSPGWNWYVSTDVDPDTREALKAALREDL
ncbi:MAG: hypothetical protein JWO76_2853 [Nocardioides sp.]|nr:hypothetical protein [Nocardioides sp.]